jgi:hypothetical protein
LFIGPESYAQAGETFDYPTWFETMKVLSKGWNSFDYRLGNGSLVMKDGGVAISVGFNVQFKFGDYLLVGHVDSVDMSYRVLESGINETTVQLGLSRIVKVLEDGSLDFLGMDEFGRLSMPNLEAGKTTSTLIPAAGSKLLGLLR